MEQQAEKYVVSAGEAGRLDAFLSARRSDLSRSHWQKIIDGGNVTVNKAARKSSYKLREGDEVAALIPPSQAIDIIAEALPLDILYEDRHLIVINKKRGMVVHPAAGNYAGTLVNALLAHCDDLSGINGEIRPGIVHRLDKDTSGVMVAAKNDAAHISLAEQIKTKTAQRQYIAVVHGRVKADNGIVDTQIGRHPTQRKKMAVVPSGGKRAVTEYTVLERYGAYTVVRCNLQTGRTHQIRVHMTYIGHPLVGDPVYGALKHSFKIIGQALHSSTLSFIHPVTGELKQFDAPLPDDMQAIINRIKNTGK